MKQDFLAVVEHRVDSIAQWVAGRCGALLFVAFVCIALLAGSTSADPDLFARLAVGRLVTELGTLPLIDPFSFSPAHPVWIDHEWLSGVVFWSVWSHLGDQGLLVLRMVLVSLWAGGVVTAARMIAPSISGTGILWVTYALSSAIFAFASPVRCQAFTYAFVPWVVVCCLRYLRGSQVRYLCVVPPLMVVWANLHGGFVLGLGILGATLVVRLCLSSFCSPPWSLRHSGSVIVIFMLTLAATGLNPYGFVAYWGYIIQALTMERPSISEWAPVTLASSLPIVLVALPVALGEFLRRRTQRVALSQQGCLGLLLLLGSCAVALHSVRMIALFGTLCAIFGWPAVEALLAWLAGLSIFAARRAVVQRSTWIAVMLLVGVGIMHISQGPRELDRSAYPQAPIEFLKGLPVHDGRLLVDFNNGSFALFHLYPKFRISLDGRYEEVYPESTRTLVEQALLTPGPVRAAALKILRPTHALLPVDASREGFGDEWVQVYGDERWVILEEMRGFS